MLSLIIPCYNEEENLPKLIEKILPLYNQESNLEVILVDNGSSDNTADVLDVLVRSTPIRTVYVPVNQGYGYGILSGLDQATGNVLAYGRMQIYRRTLLTY